MSQRRWSYPYLVSNLLTSDQFCNPQPTDLIVIIKALLFKSCVRIASRLLAVLFFTSFVYFTIFDWCVSKWETVVLVSLGKLSLDLESSQSSTSSEKNYEQRFSILLQWFFKHLDVSKKMFLCFCNENLFKAAPNSCSLCIVPTFADSLMEEISLC